MNKRNLELDRLRAFAVIMTILIHMARVYFPWSIHPEYIHGVSIINIWENSWTGVDLFFVISGYIISKMIIDKIDELRSNVNDLAYFVRNFFFRRIFRIYPVAWLVFVFVLVCTAVFNKSGKFGTTENTIEAGISIFTYTFNYYFAFGYYKGFTLSPYWSLAVEEQFYLLFPLFLIFVQSNRTRAIVLFIIVLLVTFLIRPFLNIDNIFLTQTRCDGLLYGCLVYFISRSAWFDCLIPRVEGSIYNTLITSLLVTILASVTAIGFSDNIVIPLACIISSLLVSLAAMQKNIINIFYPFSTLLDYIGSRSYSLYIVHFPVMTFTQEIMYRCSHYYQFKLDPEVTIYYLFPAIIFTLATSELLYKYIEIPFINKGKLLLGTKKSTERLNQSIIAISV